MSFELLDAAAGAMDAQRAALDVAARNVAAAEAAPGGATFARLVPRFSLAAAPETAGAAFDPAAAADDVPDPEVDGMPDSGSSGDRAVRFAGTVSERGSDADAVTEMVAVLDAQRAYEANASVFDVGKRLAERTIDLGRL